MRRLPVAAWKYGTNGYGKHQQIYCQPNAKCILNPFSPKRICIQSIFPPHSTENYVGLWNIITSSAGNVYYPYGVRQSARDQTLEKHVCFCDFVTFVLRMCNSSHTAHHNKKKLPAYTAQYSHRWLLWNLSEIWFRRSEERGGFSLLHSNENSCLQRCQQTLCLRLTVSRLSLKWKCSYIWFELALRQSLYSTSRTIPLECAIILLPCRNNQDHFHSRNYLLFRIYPEEIPNLEASLLLPHIYAASVRSVCSSHSWTSLILHIKVLYVQYGMAELVIHWTKGWWFDPWHLPSKCLPSLGRPRQLAIVAISDWVCVCEWVNERQIVQCFAHYILYVTLCFLNCPVVSPIVMVGSILKHRVFFFFVCFFCLFMARSSSYTMCNTVTLCCLYL